MLYLPGAFGVGAIGQNFLQRLAQLGRRNGLAFHLIINEQTRVARRHLASVQQLLELMRDQDERYAIVQTFMDTVDAAVGDEHIGNLQDVKLGDKRPHDKVGWNWPKLGHAGLPAGGENELRRKVGKGLKAGVVEGRMGMVNRAQGKIDDRFLLPRVQGEIVRVRLRVDGRANKEKGIINQGRFGL